MTIVEKYFTTLVSLFIQMAPYLLLGFLFAGILHVYVSLNSIRHHFAKPGIKSIIKAAIMGIPLPLCSCGVIPTGISFYKNGASKSSVVSFLIATPQTGVDSILATYSLLGLPIAVIRPFIALITGFMGGIVANWVSKKEPTSPQLDNAFIDQKKSLKNALYYGFVVFLQDIAKWLVIGILLAGLLSLILPDNFFKEAISNPAVDMLVAIAISIPLYVCATGSIPIALVLLSKGMSLGAVIVFLMAGPATNVATMVVIGKVMGKRVLFSYLISITIGALFFGILINLFFPIEWITTIKDTHIHNALEGIEGISGVILLLLIINGLYLKHFKKKKTAIL